MNPLSLELIVHAGLQQTGI